MLAIICGGGRYPLEIAKCCFENHTDFVLALISGSCDDSLDWPNVKKQKFELGRIGQLVEFLKYHNVDTIIFAGFVERPNLFNLSLDDIASKWLVKIGIGAFSGDDGLLRSIAKLFEESGFKVVHPDNYIQNLMINKSLLTDMKPTELDIADISKGINVLNSLGQYDVGQSIVVENGLIIGIECVEGTDRLISRSKSLKKNGVGGVLIKLTKNGQDMRFDIPTIGLNTVKNCHESGLHGIAIEKGKCVFLNQQESINFANANRMFIIGVEKNQEINQCTNEYL